MQSGRASVLPFAANRTVREGLLGRNLLFNLAGMGLPLLVAVLSLPLIIRGYGTDRVGLLTLAWAVLGYFSLFDLGLGRTLTKVVAEKLERDEGHEIRSLLWLSLSVMTLLSLLASVLFVLLSPLFVQRVLNIPPELQGEALATCYLLGASIPINVTTAGLRGVLEGQQRFGLTSAMRIAFGLFTFLSPLAVLPYSQSIFTVVAVLLGGRVALWLAHLIFCLCLMPASGPRPTGLRPLGHLLRQGAWMTVSNVISPLMVTLDRFLIGSLVSVGAVTYYAAPYEVVTKLLIIPTALAGVLFPMFAAGYVEDRIRSTNLYESAVKRVFFCMAPLVLIAIVFAHQGLSLWLGVDFADNSAAVLRWLAVGVLANSVAHIPFTAIQSASRSDLTAKLHLVELPLYLVILYVLTLNYLIIGAAIAWSVRCAADMVLLLVIARRLYPRAEA